MSGIYPHFGENFTMETDASIQSLGTVLLQKRNDGSFHPVAYASRAVSAAEKNYGVADLETFAVIWAVAHFRTYLYGSV